jgi:hypothetical protein
MLASAARAAVDEAIARHLISIGWRVELQAGLFDRRDERLFTTARNDAREIERRALDEEWNRQSSSDLHIAAPSLELAFCW